MAVSRILYRTALAAAVMLGVLEHAQAAPITITTLGVTLTTPAGSPDGFSLDPSTNTVNLPAAVPTVVGFQTGTFYAQYSPFNGVTFPFSFLENITINGDTESVAFTGGILVTNAVDTLTFNPGATRLFDGMSVLFEPLSLSVPANTQASFAFTEQAMVTSVPEPSTLGLLGLGLAGVGFFRRRKAQ